MVVKCKPGNKLNKKTNRCNKIKCSKNKVLNKKTNRCKSFALTNREQRYCRCLTKVRNKGIKYPYAICTNSIYNLQEQLYCRQFHPQSLTASGKYGIKSKIRKDYNLSRVPIIEDAIRGLIVKQTLFYPDLDYRKI